MKTAVIQLKANHEKQKNIIKAVDLVRKAIQKKSQFILLPEVFSYRGNIESRKQLQTVAEKIPGPSTTPIIDLARKHKVFILAGSVYEKAPAQQKVFNTSILINPSGKIVGKYRKMNLFNAVIGRKKIREANNFLSGRKTVKTKVGNFNVGLSICYDLRFSELYKKYASEGVDVLCVPAAFTQETGKAHWKILLQARAIENFCYVLAPNQTGTDNRGVANYGHSMIIDPWGTVLAEASGTKEEIIYADLDFENIKIIRKRFPSFRKR
ncbi:MAG: carbon-nitrogen hydrolase family protein [Candidatus Omnitrophica bacterium]|nr:carbon-nitrogen hydrolase family protein [Candidatus Omnitrophota bacterium]MCB9747087.1 carbon-nitrogen hydrolase family protein [Candidatus Omnitrophota bacterium]